MSATELDKAAQEASAALGLEVRVTPALHVHAGINTPIYTIRTWTAMDDCYGDGDQSITETRSMVHNRALAYLKGLEVGARIQRERHRSLTQLVRAIHAWWDDGNCALSPHASITVHDMPISDLLTEALAELEV